MVTQIYQSYQFAYTDFFGAHSIQKVMRYLDCIFVQIIFKCSCIDFVLNITELEYY